MKKIWYFLIALVLVFTLAACEMGGSKTTEKTCEEDPTQEKCQDSGIDNTQIVTDDQMKTPYTDELKFTANYAGKSFLRDGIGVVTLYAATDGDTATFKEGGTTFVVRFNGVNTPESTYKLEPWGKSASNFTKKKLQSAYKIVLQTDEIKTARLDSTLKRYLAWVWYQESETADFRLLNLEIIEQSYSSSKASGTMYADVMQDADLLVQKLNVRIYNSKVQDPDYDYSEVGKYLSLQEIRENAEEYSQSAAKVIVRGIVARKIGSYSAYIQQRADGVWYVGDQSLGIKVSDEDSDMPYVGENLNWFIGDIDTEVQAENGVAGQSLYEYYVASLAEGVAPEDEVAWYAGLEETEVDSENAYPYIVRPDEYYGIYLYGGFSGQASKLTIGYEVKVGGNFGLYAGSLQITGVTAKGIEVLNREIQEPHIYEIDDISTLTIDRTQIFNCLVELHNLTVVGGYNTKTSDGFTLYCNDANGNRINVRVDGNTALHTTKDGEYIEVAASTATTSKKGYYSEAVLDDNGYYVVNCYQFFEGMTFETLRGIVAVYDPSVEGEPSNPQVQIMLTLVTDIELSE